ncbi:MAG: hypothetical protein EXR80_03660 [Methylococcales bacterium]|nr:hypothetical protein [Methylococcales bacterium]
MLWFSETGGDGGYLFHVYVDEDAPPPLHSKAIVVDSFDAFSIPSGRLCICGAEYAANNPLAGSQFTPKGGLSVYSGMGGIVELAAGDYHLELLEIEWSDEDWDSAQEAVVPKQQLRHHRRLDILMAFCFFIGVIVLLFSTPFLLITLYNYFLESPNNCSMTQVQDLWLPTLSMLAGGLLLGAGLLLSRWHSHSAVSRLLQMVEREMPDYVLIAYKI